MRARRAVNKPGCRNAVVIYPSKFGVIKDPNVAFAVKAVQQAETCSGPVDIYVNLTFAKVFFKAENPSSAVGISDACPKTFEVDKTLSPAEYKEIPQLQKTLAHHQSKTEPMRPISSAILSIYVVACLAGAAHAGQSSAAAPKRRPSLVGVSVPKAWYEDFSAAFVVAKKQGKDLLIDFSGSDWCLPCRWLKSRVFSRPEFVTLTKNSFVLVDADDLKRGGNSPQTTERIHQLQKRYGITSFPSVILATPRIMNPDW